MINIALILLMQAGITMPQYDAILDRAMKSIDCHFSEIEKNNLKSDVPDTVTTRLFERVINLLELNESNNDYRIFFKKYNLNDPDVIAGLILKKYSFKLKNKKFNLEQEIKIAQKIQRSRELPPRKAK